MLSMKHFPAEYVDDCETMVGRQLNAWRALGPTGTAGQAFASEWCNSVVLTLELCFVHRMRGNEGKDGNPLNEVRMLATSILANGAVLAADATIKYKPERAVIGLAIGDRIVLQPEQVEELARRYFAAIREKFPPA